MKQGGRQSRFCSMIICCGLAFLTGAILLLGILQGGTSRAYAEDGLWADSAAVDAAVPMAEEGPVAMPMAEEGPVGAPMAEEGPENPAAEIGGDGTDVAELKDSDNHAAEVGGNGTDAADSGEPDASDPGADVPAGQDEDPLNSDAQAPGEGDSPADDAGTVQPGAQDSKASDVVPASPDSRNGKGATEQDRSQERTGLSGKGNTPNVGGDLVATAQSNSEGSDDPNDVVSEYYTDDGDYYAYYADGSWYHRFADGRWQRGDAEGNYWGVRADGTRWWNNADSSSYEIKPDGSWERHDADGSWEYQHADGSWERGDADRNWERGYADGSWERGDDDGNSWGVRADGTAWFKNCFDGRTRISSDDLAFLSGSKGIKIVTVLFVNPANEPVFDEWWGVISIFRKIAYCKFEDIFPDEKAYYAVKHAQEYVLLSAPEGVSLTSDGVLSISKNLDWGSYSNAGWGSTFVRPIKVKAIYNGKAYIQEVLLQKYRPSGGLEGSIRLVKGYSSAQEVPRRAAFQDRSPAGTYSYRQISNVEGITVSETGDVTVQPYVPAGTYAIDVEISSGGKSRVVTLNAIIESMAELEEGLSAITNEGTPAGKRTQDAEPDNARVEAPVSAIVAALLALSALAIAFLAVAKRRRSSKTRESGL